MQNVQQGQLTDLLIKSNELIQLNSIIEIMPTKYGLPLVQFFSQVSQLRNQELLTDTPPKKSKHEEEIEY